MASKHSHNGYPSNSTGLSYDTPSPTKPEACGALARTEKQSLITHTTPSFC